jgi:hypothetical protein
MQMWKFGAPKTVLQMCNSTEPQQHEPVFGEIASGKLASATTETIARLQRSPFVPRRQTTLSGDQAKLKSKSLIEN